MIHSKNTPIKQNKNFSERFIGSKLIREQITKKTNQEIYLSIE